MSSNAASLLALCNSLRNETVSQPSQDSQRMSLDVPHRGKSWISATNDFSRTCSSPFIEQQMEMRAEMYLRRLEQSSGDRLSVSEQYFCRRRLGAQKTVVSPALSSQTLPLFSVKPPGHTITDYLRIRIFQSSFQAVAVVLRGSESDCTSGPAPF